ncbi:MAG: alpha/beta hydrolase [Candidatus Saganbacteria bacterium]|nr:alpha/beta hydrolase [Candidatus Saganbacteria bacterium]
MLYHEVSGSGEPLLLISGLGADNSCWGGVVKSFSKRFQTIVFDNPGSGRSSIFKKPHTIRHLADDAVKLLNYLGIKRAHLIGHSMGGYIAQEIAINYPKRVNKLILEGTAPVSSSRNNVLFSGFAKKLKEKEPIEKWITTWSSWLFSKKTFDSGLFVETFIKNASKYPYPSTAEGFSAQVDAMAKFDTRSRLSEIKAKTLIIEGEDDILIRPDEARVLAKQIPGSKIRLIKNVAHYVHLENPSLFTKIAMGFLGN